MKKEKYISERISYFDHSDKTTVIISSKVDRWKEGLLLLWVVAWTLCGAYFIYELATGDYDDNTRIAFFVMIAFWAYFEFRIGKALLWRKFGMEFMSLDEDALTIKRSIGSYGKAHRYFWDNIQALEVMSLGQRSVIGNLESSFWYVGGERIQFVYNEKKVRFGRQLDPNEAKQLAQFLPKQRKKHQHRYTKAQENEMQDS